MKSFSDYAKENNVSYHTLYQRYKAGKLDNIVKDSAGSLMVLEKQPEVVVAHQTQPTEQTNFFEMSKEIVPKTADTDKYKSSFASTRLNRSALVQPYNRFTNIDNGYLPFSYDGTNKNNTNISACDVIKLAQKAYFNFSIVRNVIDVMTEFCVSKIYLTGGNETSRNFFSAYFNNINLDDLQERFFREFWRSGNVFLYPLNIQLQKEDVNMWIKEFKLSQSVAERDIQIPAKYIILNPTDIQIQGATSFLYPKYYKTLTPHELENLRKPKNEIDQRIFDNLPGNIKNLILNKRNSLVSIELPENLIYAIFYKKQDYEAFAVPMVFPVLDDLEWKSELKKIDQSISRTVQQAILLITVGYESKDGKYCVNKQQIDTIEAIFKNESVGRVLINDFTTKAQFVIPEIGDILDPKKYEIVNEDIRNGLNDILMGGTNSEKFANHAIRVKVFIGRLLQARETFLNNFLIPEIKKISKQLNFKSYPTPKFEDIDLEDSVEWVRAMTRLGEIGILTPEEVINSIETGRLPTPSESLESQKTHKELKDSGFYEPISGGPYTQEKLAKIKGTQTGTTSISGPNGRPPGSKRPQSTKNVKPRSLSSTTFSATKVKDNIILAETLKNKVIKTLKGKFKLKKLNEQQTNVADGITELIIANESPENWINATEQYCNKPVDTNKERVEILNEIAVQHQVDNFIAGILLNSILDQNAKS